MYVNVSAKGGMEAELGFDQRSIEFDTAITLKGLLTELGAHGDVLISVNNAIVHVDQWAQTLLSDGDNVQVLPPLASG